MNSNLETKIDGQGPFKSAGERKIADVLSKYGLPFKYESPLLVQDNQEKPRIWYPAGFPHICADVARHPRYCFRWEGLPARLGDPAVCKVLQQGNATVHQLVTEL